MTKSTDLILLEDCLWIAVEQVGLPLYDFDFSRFFAVRRPWERPDELSVIGRFGANPDYDARFEAMRADGLVLIHDPATHHLASRMSDWYPFLQDLTPRSVIWPGFPTGDEIEAEFDWPVFIKGDRQTSRHRADFAIFRSRAEYEAKRDEMIADPIMGWQPIAVREYLNLRPVGEGIDGKIPPSFEFRTFWWKGELVGEGAYYRPETPYRWTREERARGLSLAQHAVERLKVPFLTVDLAQTMDRKWVLIEVNDGQESGYCGVSPLGLWQRIVEVERLG